LQQKWSETAEWLVRYPILAHFPEKINKRGANLVKSTFTNILFNPRMIWYHKGSPPVLFWDEKRPWLGRGGLLCGNSVLKCELEFCPDHWGGPFGPKFHEPSSYIIQHDLYQESHISGHLLC
jgi:hypothetical protein